MIATFVTSYRPVLGHTGDMLNEMAVASLSERDYQDLELHAMVFVAKEIEQKRMLLSKERRGPVHEYPAHPPRDEEKIPLKNSSNNVNAPIVTSKQRRAPRSRMDLVVLWLAVFLLAVLVVIGAIDSVPLRSLQGSAATNSNQTASTGQTMNMGSDQAKKGTASTAAVAAHQTYNPQIPPVLQGSTVDVKLTIKEQLVTIAQGVAYHAWTFNGTVPGPIIHVRQGQLVHTTITNDGSMGHSIDFHAAQTPWNVNYQEIPAGTSFTINKRADYPGVFMYHCGTPTVIDHMANGMYGTIIVDPAT